MMLRLLATGLQQRGLAVPPAAVQAVRPGAPATCALEHKRALVASVLAHGGASLLWQLAGGIDRLAGTPLYQAMAGAPAPHELVARWQRLERYLHAWHRIALVDSAPGTVSLLHHAPGRPQPPLAVETLLVFGVLSACLRLAGARGLSVSVAGMAACEVEQVDEAMLSTAAVGPWRFAWHDEAPGPRVASIDEAPPAAWPEIARRVSRAVAADLAGRHTVATLATSLATSGRSLQRELGRHGYTLSGLMAELRSRAAARWLAETDEASAHVGFACGYADQAHFTRAFTRAVGVPPARYRQLLRG